MTVVRSDVILQRMMALHPRTIDLTLDRVWRLLAALGDPQKALPPVIHIAGTNGKGSTQAMLRAGLEAAEHRVHAYTSPHLAWFHERLRLAGEPISEPALSALLAECEATNGDAPITWFEITTCAAFLAFARTPADYLLLEVGLGGRLDATNVIKAPALTAITPVSLDHQQFLGETLPGIAGEKAGILKRGVPCVVGPQQDAALQVIRQQAAHVGAPLLVHRQHWHVGEEQGRLVYQDKAGRLDLPLPNLPGAHQIDNAGVAITALRQLGLDEAACAAAVTRAEWPARMQRLREGPLVEAADGAELWLDAGHNPAAGAAIAQLLGTQEQATVLVCGMLNTKDAQGYLRPLAQVVDRLFAVSIPGEANTLSAEDTMAAAQGVDMPAQAAASVLDAVRTARALHPSARILICGSLYLAGAVLRENG